MGGASTFTLPNPGSFDMTKCSTMGCQRPGVRSRGCNVCKADLTTCSQHLVETIQDCVSVLGSETISTQREAEISTLLAQINLPALLRVASSLNHGRFCTIKPGSTSMMGCCNYHIHIFFPDSAEQWLVRIPRPGLAALHRKIDVEYQYASEFATLKFLEGTKVPAPKVFAFDVASNTGNAVGTTYLIMEFLAGTPFNPHSATLEEKKRVYDGVAEILIELSKHPLPKACSLAPTGPIYGEDGPFVAKIAGLRSKIAQPFGPFETAKDYHMAIIEAHLSLIEEGTLYPEHAVEAYLTYSILQERISELYSRSPDIDANLKLGEKGPKEAGTRREELESFYLTHIDAKGDHILLSPSGHISGIIDWQGARFSPYDEAFGPSLLTADLHALYFGRSGTTPNDHLLAASLIEKGEARLADAMKGDERARRFHFGLGSARMEREMWDSIRGLLVAFEIYEGEGFELWRERAMARYRGDLRLERLLERSGRFGDESQVVYLASRLVTPVC